MEHVTLRRAGSEQLGDLAYLCRECRQMIKPLVKSGHVNSVEGAKHVAVIVRATNDLCNGEMTCRCERCQLELRSRMLMGIRPSRGIPRR